MCFFDVRYFNTNLLTVSFLALCACGGSGGGTTATTPILPPPSANTGPTWTKDVFQNEANFKDRCSVIRSGTNPATGQPYPDVAGSSLYEKHWMRSWSNNTYLWYNEIIDRDPASIADRLDYFEVLKTEATTASGNAKDRFHFSINTSEYQELISSGASAGYGFELALISRSVPRDIRIAFTEPNSPARADPANLARGDIILEVNGVDAINGSSQSDVDTLNAALFPAETGESHTFKIRDLDTQTDRTFTITSAVVTTESVNITKTIDVAGAKVGYLHFTTFGTSSAEQALFDAMTDFQNNGITELVLDLRYNGGGFLDIAGELGYMIAGAAQTTGRDFDKIVFNDKHPTINPVTGNTITPTPFHSTGQGFSVPNGTALPSVNLNRVFILSTSGTCSASEAVINGLRGVDVEVVLIGTTTCGKPYGFYGTDNCGETYFTIQFRGENDKGFGDYADGFTPIDTAVNNGELITGCEVGDDFSKLLGDESEAQLATALSYMQTGTCPVRAEVSGVFSKTSVGDSVGDNVMSLLGDERVRNLYLLKNSRIENLPIPDEDK